MAARRHRSIRTVRELREEAEAAEARGLVPAEPAAPRRERSVTPREPARTRPKAQPRMRVVWAVCDVGGRTVATFDYASKPEAEAHAAALAARGKGMHFVRSIKEEMTPDG
jgi:hypothetical protein